MLPVEAGVDDDWPCSSEAEVLLPVGVLEDGWLDSAGCWLELLDDDVFWLEAVAVVPTPLAGSAPLADVC